MLEPATYALTHPWSSALSGKIIKTLFFIDNTSYDSKTQEASAGPRISVRPCLSFDLIHICGIGRKKKKHTGNVDQHLGLTNKVSLQI